MIAEKKVRETGRMRKTQCVMADLKISGGKKREQPLRAKNRQQLIARKKTGPQTYNHKVLDSIVPTT